MRNAKTTAQRAFLTELQKTGPGPTGEPTYPYRFTCLHDADFLDALGRDDLGGARNALSAIVARLYLSAGKPIPESVKTSLKLLGAKEPRL